jgi:uncharacterized protein YtpQ (UPF0354 family)
MGFFDKLLKKKQERRAALADSFRALLLERFPEATMEERGELQFRVEIPEREGMTVFLHNLFRQAEGVDPERADAAIRGHFNAMFPEKDPGCEEPDASQIVPTIKDQVYIDQAGAMMPFVQEHLVADLYIVYAVDLPTQIKTLKQEQLDALGISAESLREVAIENLRTMLPPLEKHGEGPWFLLTAGNYYTASVLLLDAVWEQMQEFVEGDIVVAVPARDTLLVTGSASAGGITALRTHARQIEEGGSYTISQTLLRRKAGKWVALS